MADSTHAQGQIFAAHAPLGVSWITHAGWLPHQRLENDLIAAWIERTGQVPAAQFRG